MNPYGDEVNDGVVQDGVVAAPSSRQTAQVDADDLSFVQLVVQHPMLGVGVLGYALAVGLTRGLTAPPQVIMAIFGWGLCFWLATSPPGRGAAPRRLSLVGVLVWVVVALVLAGLELYNYSIDAGRTWEHPTLSELTDPALDTFPVRFAATIAWLAAGWHLIRR